jgi:hypothetical protein
MKTREPFLILIILILSGLLFFLWRSSGEKDDTYHRDREQVLKHDAHMKRELSLRDSLILVLRSARVESNNNHVKKMDSSEGKRKGLIAKERKQRPDTIRITLVDTIFTSFETDLKVEKAQRKADSSSFEKEIHLLGSKVDILGKENDYRLLKLDSAYTQLSDISGKLENRNKALTWSVFGNIALALLLILIL